MIMNQYELIYVTRPTLNAEELANLSTKVSGLIEKAKGQVLATEEWGRRRLAYPILKNEHGLYTYINFVAPADVPLGVEKSKLALGANPSRNKLAVAVSLPGSYTVRYQRCCLFSPRHAFFFEGNAFVVPSLCISNPNFSPPDNSPP